VFERDGVADGARVAEWKNVAQICYQGFLETADRTANGYDIVNDCTYAKKEGTQTVLGGNNRHVEALKQDNPHHQPLYKKNVLNGHGKRKAAPPAARCASCEAQAARSRGAFVSWGARAPVPRGGCVPRVTRRCVGRRGAVPPPRQARLRRTIS
jgi:hypothetical protein